MKKFLISLTIFVFIGFSFAETNPYFDSINKLWNNSLSSKIDEVAKSKWQTRSDFLNGFVWALNALLSKSKQWTKLNLQLSALIDVINWIKPTQNNSVQINNNQSISEKAKSVDTPYAVWAYPQAWIPSEFTTFSLDDIKGNVTNDLTLGSITIHPKEWAFVIDNRNSEKEVNEFLEKNLWRKIDLSSFLYEYWTIWWKIDSISADSQTVMQWKQYTNTSNPYNTFFVNNWDLYMIVWWENDFDYFYSLKEYEKTLQNWYYDDSMSDRHTFILNVKKKWSWSEKKDYKIVKWNLNFVKINIDWIKKNIRPEFYEYFIKMMYADFNNFAINWSAWQAETIFDILNAYNSIIKDIDWLFDRNSTSISDFDKFKMMINFIYSNFKPSNNTAWWTWQKLYEDAKETGVLKWACWNLTILFTKYLIFSKINYKFNFLNVKYDFWVNSQRNHIGLKLFSDWNNWTDFNPLDKFVSWNSEKNPLDYSSELDFFNKSYWTFTSSSTLWISETPFMVK